MKSDPLHRDPSYTFTFKESFNQSVKLIWKHWNEDECLSIIMKQDYHYQMSSQRAVWCFHGLSIEVRSCEIQVKLPKDLTRLAFFLLWKTFKGPYRSMKSREHLKSDENEPRSNWKLREEGGGVKVVETLVVRNRGLVILIYPDVDELVLIVILLQIS